MNNNKRSWESNNIPNENSESDPKKTKPSISFDYPSDEDCQSIKSGRYSEDSIGPFIVYVEDKREDHQLGNYHEILFAHKISKVNKDCIKISKKD